MKITEDQVEGWCEVLTALLQKYRWLINSPVLELDDWQHYGDGRYCTLCQKARMSDSINRCSHCPIGEFDFKSGTRCTEFTFVVLRSHLREACDNENFPLHLVLQHELVKAARVRAKWLRKKLRKDGWVINGLYKVVGYKGKLDRKEQH